MDNRLERALDRASIRYWADGYARRDRQVLQSARRLGLVTSVPSLLKSCRCLPAHSWESWASSSSPLASDSGCAGHELAAYVASAWLLGVAANLVTAGFYDVAVTRRRDGAAFRIHARTVDQKCVEEAPAFGHRPCHRTATAASDSVRGRGLNRWSCGAPAQSMCWRALSMTLRRLRTERTCPWPVRLRNLRSTSVLITTTHVSRSMPSNRWACGSVTLSPGISAYSAWTRRVRSRTVATCLSVSGTVRVTMNVPRDSAYIVRRKKDSKSGFMVSRVTPEVSARLRSGAEVVPEQSAHGGVPI